MLILTRRLNESIVLGEDIRIKLVGVDEASLTVKVELIAPESVCVNEQENNRPSSSVAKPTVVIHKRRKTWSL